ncbi:MAG: glycoside hydrolase family 99-like domain-containing protein, partial [Desulfovibrio sp.]|nr:glycoside hydrolase family 99-like domain-containing protein [Desulfovibrio sp.]
NFAGHTVLEAPLRKILKNKEIKNNFCLCWAHPGWYDNRLGPKAVFLKQDYSLVHAKPLFAKLRPYFEDPRYLRVGEQPMLLIWAPERHPTICSYAEILKEESQKHGYPGLYLLGVEAYEARTPESLGLDAMVEFAPNWLRENHVSLPNERPVRIDYDKTINFMLNKEVPAYLRLRCTFPAWDNTPRRGLQGIACVNIHPNVFKSALHFLSTYTEKILPKTHQYVFINAWNEWGEGCHLEPDQQYGTKYLDIVKQVDQMHCKSKK